jgi:choline-sulfatase
VSRELTSSLLALLPAALAAVIVDLLFDSAVMSGDSGGMTLVLAFGLEVALLSPAALALAFAAYGAAAMAPVLGLEKAGPRRAAALCAGLVLLGIAALVHLVLFRVYFAGLSASFLEKRGLAGLVVGVAVWVMAVPAVALGLAVAGALGQRLVGLPEQAARRVERAVLWLIAAGALAVLGMALFLWNRLDNLKLAAQGPIVAYVWLLVLVGSFLALRRLRFGLGAALAACLVVVVLLGSVLSGALLSEERRSALESQMILPRALLASARSALDRDGDGFAALLGGGDCDDANPEVSPAADEIPGNGIDDDCDDGDAPEEEVAKDLPKAAKASAVAEKPAPPKATTPDGGEAGAPTPTAADSGPPPPPKQPAKQARHVLLILIDTLRSDHVSAFGYERPTTPELDRLISRAAAFPNAYAAANNTPRSIPSIFIGRHPSEIPWAQRKRNFPALKKKADLLGEVMTRAGIEAVAVTDHFYFQPKRRLGQGFTTWDNGRSNSQTIKASNTHISSPDVTRRALSHLRRLAGAGERFFLFVHYGDPHARYMVHKSGPRFGRKLKDKYDGEIAYTDRYVGELLAEVDKLGLTDKTAVVVLSDHGEAFGDHRFHFHGHNLHEEEIRVPLIMAGPGVKPGIRKLRVSLVDVLPTLAKWTGAFKELAPGLPGRSLLPAAFGGELPAVPVYAQLLPYPAWPEEQHAIVLGEFKILFHRNRNIWELYDLEQDPREKRNLIRKHPRKAELKGLLKRYMKGERSPN